MGFWTDISVEPKRSYRWIVNIGGIPQWIAKKVQKPNYNITETEHTYINHKFYYPGKVEWQPITLTLVDPIDPDASRTLQDILAASGYHFPENPNDVTTISKSGAVSSLGRVVISQLGAEGDDVVEEWLLTNAWIQSVNFGELDYESDDMTEIEITLRYDYAQLIRSGTPVPLG